MEGCPHRHMWLGLGTCELVPHVTEWQRFCGHGDHCWLIPCFLYGHTAALKRFNKSLRSSEPLLLTNLGSSWRAAHIGCWGPVDWFSSYVSNLHRMHVESVISPITTHKIIWYLSPLLSAALHIFPRFSPLLNLRTTYQS